MSRSDEREMWAGRCTRGAAGPRQLWNQGLTDGGRRLKESLGEPGSMSHHITDCRVVVIFRNDDLSGLSDVRHEVRVAEIFERYGVRQTLGVIPLCAGESPYGPVGGKVVPLGANQEMARFLCDYAERSGSEIALHGYTHQTNRYSRPSKKEYFEFQQLGMQQQEFMIRRGTDILARALNVRPKTFIPPWNRSDMNTVRACARNGYEIVSAGVYSPITDGVVSLGTNCDIHSFLSLLEATQSGRRRVFLRILYHSNTISTEREFRALEQAVRLASKTPGCEPMTISEAVRRYPAEVRLVNEAGKNVAPDDRMFGSTRERAVVYRRAVSVLPEAKKLEEAYARARVRYQAGEYEEVESLSVLIDRLCARLLVRGRFTVVSTCFVLWLVVVGVLGRVGVGLGLGVYGVSGVVALALAGTGWWCATAPGTKREIVCAGVLGGAGGALGVVLGHLLSGANIGVGPLW